MAKNGFDVIETTDGKGAYDLTKKERPDLVVLAVELAAGQSGYLVCGKLKKDDDLKKTPVIIIGKDPEGFEGHKKLKTRAEEYLKKPFAPEALTVKVGRAHRHARGQVERGRGAGGRRAALARRARRGNAQGRPRPGHAR